MDIQDVFGRIRFSVKNSTINNKKQYIIMKRTLYLCFFIISVFGCVTVEASAKKAKTPQRPLTVIFETDMGNDIDDALALDMLYKYMQQGKINLVAISSNKQSPFSAEFIDVMNTWYGYPHIPIGVVHNGIDCENDAKNYAKCVSEMTIDGKPAFTKTIADYSTLPDAVELYRKILSQQADQSVTIISVGFSTNLSRLLDSNPDCYSRLSGKELVGRKVKLLSVMGGSFGEKSLKEYNIVKDIPAAKKLFALWPSEIVVDPFEIGIQITYPASSIQNDFHWTNLHPMVEAYKCYQPMPYDRPTWDLCAVLCAVEPRAGFFTQSRYGSIVVDEEGYTHFYSNQNGRRSYLSVTPQQVQHIKAYFVRFISSKPKWISDNYKK
jgi:inosine-uridine nucleoside N-ribohydrolase